MVSEQHFTPALFEFLADLRDNNDRAWFNENRERYQRDVRDPILRFIADFAPRLTGISLYFVADSRPNGGSMFRIYRDIRFSRDKSPYKGHAGIQFRHELAKDAHAPGFYLHLEPGAPYTGAGLWHPDSATLAKIRGAIVADPGRWTAALPGDGFELDGESLVRPPRGFDPDHPLIEDLKRRDFVAGTALTEEQVCSPDFMDEYTELCYAVAPLVEYLTRAVGLNF